MTTYKDLAGSYASSTGAKLEIRSVISSRVVSFKGFLTNISQDFKSNWSTENVYGRMDPIATFQNTTRTVAVSLNVPAATVQEGVNNQASFSTLSQMLYPAYLKSASKASSAGSSADAGAFSMVSDVPGEGVGTVLTDPVVREGTRTMAKSPLVRVKFGNLIRTKVTTQGKLGNI